MIENCTIRQTSFVLHPGSSLYQKQSSEKRRCPRDLPITMNHEIINYQLSNLLSIDVIVTQKAKAVRLIELSSKLLYWKLHRNFKKKKTEKNLLKGEPFQKSKDLSFPVCHPHGLEVWGGNHRRNAHLKIKIISLEDLKSLPLKGYFWLISSWRKKPWEDA